MAHETTNAGSGVAGRVAVRWVVLAWLLVGSAAGCSAPPDQSQFQADVADELGGPADAGFARAVTRREFRFPYDHGPHRDYRIEWWYVTGNLYAGRAERYGFQVTFFRIGLSAEAVSRASRWATTETWMAHFAVTDSRRGKFHAFERLARGAAGLAGAERAPLRVWLEDWQLRSKSGDSFPWQLTTSAGSVALTLELHPLKDVVLQGDEGLSQKSPEPGNASYYYSITRMRAQGTLRIDGESHQVDGTAWLDREWSTSALAPDQAGWDWFALQLDSGSELMFYRLRRKDGTQDRHSQGVFVAADGAITRLAPADVDLVAVARWRNRYGDVYPIGWRLTLRPMRREFEIVPVLQDQELDLSVRYWEGAVDVLDLSADAEVIGRGYLELSGYSR